MYMSDQEIISSYKTAEDQKAQVKILADLNACARSEMLDKLTELGILTEKSQANPIKTKEQISNKKPYNWSPHEVEQLIKLMSDGESIAQAAQKIGRPKSGVHKKAYTLGLLSPASEKKKPHKKANIPPPSDKNVLLENIRLMTGAIEKNWNGTIEKINASSTEVLIVFHRDDHSIHMLKLVKGEEKQC